MAYLAGVGGLDRVMRRHRHGSKRLQQGDTVTESPAKQTDALAAERRGTVAPRFATRCTW
jgi:hypothetical protein